LVSLFSPSIVRQYARLVLIGKTAELALTNVQSAQIMYLSGLELLGLGLGDMPEPVAEGMHLLWAWIKARRYAPG
jgi:NADPH:quinone reductase-like Zn-dependent oxidoreductase